MKKLSLIWYQHMLPYPIFETQKMLPWGEDKILFTGLFILPPYDGCGSFSGWSCQIKNSNGNRFFAIYDVSCRRLNLNIVEIKDISCEDSTCQIKVVATSPLEMNLFHNDESLAQDKPISQWQAPASINFCSSFWYPRLESLCTWPEKDLA